MTAYAIRMGVPEMEDHWNDVLSLLGLRDLAAELCAHLTPLMG